MTHFDQVNISTWDSTSTDDWPSEDGTTYTQTTYTYPPMTCPHCHFYMANSAWFHYCPYCGKSLWDTSKQRIMERLDTIMKELEAIKKAL